MLSKNTEEMWEVVYEDMREAFEPAALDEIVKTAPEMYESTEERLEMKFDVDTVIGTLMWLKMLSVTAERSGICTDEPDSLLFAVCHAVVAMEAIRNG